MKGHIERRGETSWRLIFDLGKDAVTGRRRTQRVTFHGTKREAQRRLTQVLADVGQGRYVEPAKLLVGDYVKERIDIWSDSGSIGGRTTERYKQLLKCQVRPHIGGKALQALSVGDVERWHATLRASGLAQQTILNAHRVLSKTLRDAMRHGLVVKNVASLEGARPPRVERAEIEIIPNVRIGEVLSKMRGRAPYPKVVVALFTGLRRGELLALRWGDVDLTGKTLRVRQALEETRTGVKVKATKTRAGRRDIDLPDIVVEVLRDHRKDLLELRMRLGAGKLGDDDLVFPALDGGPQRPSNLSGDWREAVEVLQLPKVTFHALRHTHASQLIDSGLDVVRISKRLGHADPSITLKIYAHLFKSGDRSASAAINAALSSL
jgi:integrase